MRFEIMRNDMIQVVSALPDMENGRWFFAIMSELLDDMPAVENYVGRSILTSKLREAAGAETQVAYRDNELLLLGGSLCDWLTN